MATTVGHRLNNTGTCTPQIMENIAGTHRYGVSINATDGNAVFFRADMAPTTTERADGSWIDQVFDLSTITNNPLKLPMAGWNIVPYDDHFGLAIGVDDQDRAWIVGNAHPDNGTTQHDGPLRWVRCDNMSDPTNAANWSSPAYPFAATGSNSGHTYNHFRRLSDGTLLFFTSQRDDTGGSPGRDFICFYLDQGTDNWLPLITDTVTDIVEDNPYTEATAAAGHFIVATDTPNVILQELYDGPANRAYITGALVEDRGEHDRLHVSIIWRTRDSNGNSSQKPGYVYCDDPIGGTANWVTITGESQPMPITWDNKVDSLSATDNQIHRNFSLGLMIDESGWPHMILENGGSVVAPDTEKFENDPTIAEDTMEVYWDGSAWAKRGVPAGGIGATQGPILAYAGSTGYMIAALGSRCRLSPNWGQNGQTGHLKLGAAYSGSEPNIDPVSWTRRGEIAIMLPDGDNPRVYTHGANEDCLPAPDQFQNINPGP